MLFPKLDDSPMFRKQVNLTRSPQLPRAQFVSGKGKLKSKEHIFHLNFDFRPSK